MRTKGAAAHLPLAPFLLLGGHTLSVLLRYARQLAARAASKRIGDAASYAGREAPQSGEERTLA